MLWKDKGCLTNGINAQALESFKCLSNVQAPEVLKRWLSGIDIDP